MAIREEIDIKKLRYVLYARRSTTDETNQQRSIPDQIKDCRRLAESYGLNVVRVIEEKGSAKKPGERPLFKDLLKDIENKKYDAILCWHPDRLCRNMLEGGQIINMLDVGSLKDLQFYSHRFSNDANGKMLLGMLFVFSKQYSDDLSDKVNRGVQGNLEEGKSQGAPKHGYTRDTATGWYEPNEWFDVIQEAWLMRGAGSTVDAVLEFIQSRDYHRMTTSRKISKKIGMARSSLANMFKDPFYYGILVQAEQSVDLRGIYDFKPMISQETYDQVQSLGYGRSKDKAGSKKRAAFYPLRGMVYCAICNGKNYMKVGKNRSQSGEYGLTYRCDNPDCAREVKSFRAKHIFNSIYSMLEKLELSEEAYTRYSAKLDSLTDEKIITIQKEILSMRGSLAHVKKELKERGLGMGTMDKTTPAYKVNEDQTIELANKRDGLELDIKKLEDKVKDPKKIKLNREEFLNLIKTAPHKMRAGSAVEKDILCRILFLNLRVDNTGVANYIWNEPFDSLVKLAEIQTGGPGWT